MSGFFTDDRGISYPLADVLRIGWRADEPNRRVVWMRDRDEPILIAHTVYHRVFAAPIDHVIPAEAGAELLQLLPSEEADEPEYVLRTAIIAWGVSRGGDVTALTVDGREADEAGIFAIRMPTGQVIVQADFSYESEEKWLASTRALLAGDAASAVKP